MKSHLFFALMLLLTVPGGSFAQDMSLKYGADIKSSDKLVLSSVMQEVADLLPAKMKRLMPPNLEIKIVKITEHKSIPTEVCKGPADKEKKEVNEKSGFVYGHYNQRENALSINAAVFNELARGREKSVRINCQHKSLYDQAIATIVHELTHAYDFHNGRPSTALEYIRRAGFKKGLLKVKNKNIAAMRPADPYELVNIAESFAVNMEYFTMDPEFMCRKPSMFDYFKKQFEVDPFPARKCAPNRTVLMSTLQGFIPVSLDPERVYRVDYLLASAGQGVSSGFGHSMFRIVMCAPERHDAVTGKLIPATPFGKRCLNDKLFHVVVSYRANVEDATLNYLKGLFGGYPSMLFILNLGDVLDEYNRDELRDVVAYPLSLSAKEREEFVTRVIEEHWNYRGSYKFINNNCAVESYDLLKSALLAPNLNQQKSLTPNGVLEDLDRLQFTSMSHDEKETYYAKTQQLVLAYKSAYGAKLKNNEKHQKNAVLEFMEDSEVNERMKRFNKFQNSPMSNMSMNEEVLALKDRMVKASSFSVMEQQILRTLALKFRKQAADMFMNTEDEKIKKMLQETGAAFAQSLTDMSHAGYGIPFREEMVTVNELEQKLANSTQALKKADALLRELMPVEYAALEGISENIKVYNNYSLKVRKEFRQKLENYIVQVLTNLAGMEETRTLLISAQEGNIDSLKRVRELLGQDLVTEKEILDLKLRKIIAEIL